MHQGLERRADKQIARQEDALVRAVVMVWKAHERGRLLERVQNAKLLRQTWEAWKKRLRHQRELEGLVSEIMALICSALLTDTVMFRCCTLFRSTLSGSCHVLSTPSLAQTSRYATGRERVCLAVC
jgi:hypothetical protein